MRMRFCVVAVLLCAAAAILMFPRDEPPSTVRGDVNESEPADEAPRSNAEAPSTDRATSPRQAPGARTRPIPSSSTFSWCAPNHGAQCSSARKFIAQRVDSRQIGALPGL